MSNPVSDVRYDEQHPPRALLCMRSITRCIPPLPHASGLSNRIVKPIWRRVSEQSVVLPVWGKTRMLLCPADTIGGNLTFIPQLWDRWERAYVRKHLGPGSVFVDVGSNIGAYALWAAEAVGASGRVIAIEPDPITVDVLRRNIALNGLESVISVYHTGVSDRDEVLWVERPCEGSMGLTRLVPGGNDAGEGIACHTLASVLRSANASRVDMLKIDIEGSETKVLTEFFRETAMEQSLRPLHLLVEFDEGPLSSDGKQSLAQLILDNGYEMVHTGANAVFRKA